MWLNLYSIFIYVSTFYAIFMVYWFSRLNLNYYFIVSKSEISLLEKWAMAFRWLVLLFPHLSSHFYAFSWFFRQFPLNQNWHFIVSKCAKSLLRTGWHLSPFNGLQHYRCFIYLEQCQLFLTKLPPLLIQRPLVASSSSTLGKQILWPFRHWHPTWGGGMICDVTLLCTCL